MALARGDGQIFMFRYATQKAATGVVRDRATARGVCP